MSTYQWRSRWLVPCPLTTGRSSKRCRALCGLHVHVCWPPPSHCARPFRPQARVIDAFLTATSGQLTFCGLASLHETCRERELSVFFRNNHFNCMFKVCGGGMAGAVAVAVRMCGCINALYSRSVRRQFVSPGHGSRVCRPTTSCVGEA